MAPSDTAKFQAWANKGHWTNWTRKPERAADLEHLVWNELTRINTKERISTTNLVDRILPGLDDIGRDYVAVGLNHLRKNGKLARCYSRGAKNPRTFGHKSFIWHNPLIPYVGADVTEEPIDGTEGLEDML